MFIVCTKKAKQSVPVLRWLSWHSLDPCFLEAILCRLPEVTMRIFSRFHSTQPPSPQSVISYSCLPTKCSTVSTTVGISTRASWHSWRVHFAVPFLTAPLAFDALNFAISFSTALSTLLRSSGRYPSLKRISIQTKNGARTSACTRLSRSAGARPSNLPCPMNWAIHETTNTPKAIWLVG